MAGCGDHSGRWHTGCGGCQAANRSYLQRRTKRLADGTWLPRVDAAEVRAHVAGLQADGLSLAGIARAAGVDKSTVIDLPKRRWVTGAVAAAIRSVRTGDAAPAGFVRSIGAARMVQALCALGWGYREQAHASGLSRTVLCYIGGHRHRLISTANLSRVRALFEQLSGTPGPSRQTRLAAQRKGWLPPLGWEDVEAGVAAQDDTDVSSVDEVAIERALAGDSVALTDEELAAAVQVGAGRGLSLAAMGRLLGLNPWAVQRLAAGKVLQKRPGRPAKRAAS